MKFMEVISTRFPGALRALAWLSTAGEVMVSGQTDPTPAPAAHPHLEVVSVEINEVRLPVEKWRDAVGERGRPFSVGSVWSLRVEFREVVGASKVAHQLRHSLEGHGNRWHPVVAHAQMTVRFLDEQMNVVASRDYTFGAESAGWRGAAEGSVFHPRMAELEAPARARWAQLVAIPSVPAMVGVYAFQGVRVSTQPPAGGAVRVLEYSADEGTDLDQPLGSPRYWARTGTRSEQARVVRLGDGSHALSILDQDPHTFGGWILRTENLAPVTAGEKVRITWNECFSVARGGQGIADYGYLEPGKAYRLQMGVRSVEGREVEGGTVLAFEISPLWWKRPAVWMGTGVVVLGAVLSVFRSVTRRRVQQRIRELDQRNAIEQERSRIARDIHDELGASLAQISLLSSLARTELPAGSEVGRTLDSIGERASGAARQLAEIVWAVNPARDSIEHLVGFLCSFAQEHLALAGVGFRTDIPDELIEIPLGSSMRYNIFLSVRELVHNAVKHGGPTLVYLRVRCVDGELRIEVEDNGRGFNPATVPEGRGLANVRERMQQMGGTMKIVPMEGAGSLVVLRLKMNARMQGGRAV